MLSTTYFTIYGERCSGTNFVRKLVFDNFELALANLPENDIAGWKHFFGSEKNIEAIKKSQEWCLIFSVVRNPIDYLMSFWKQPHHQSPDRTKDLETFLTSEFYSINKKGEILCDRPMSDPSRRYKNIFEMRATKLRWMKEVLPTLTPTQVFARMEDLKTNGEQILGDWQTKFNLPRISDQYVVEKKRVEPQVGGWYRFHLNERPLGENYPVEDPKIREIIRNNLDFEAESLAGYDKESILARL